MRPPSGTPKIYELGVWIGYLEAIIDNEQIDWRSVREALQSLVVYKTVEGLEFIGNEAQSQLLSLAHMYKYNYKRQFSKDDRINLANVIQNWYGRLEEVKKRWLILVPNLAVDVSKLTSGSKAFFLEEEWARLSSLEQQGLNEAANCMLSNNFTACEFMALRTVESVLRRWYETKTGKTTQFQSDLFKLLDEVYPDTSNRPKEISALFHLKNRRNAIAHPEVISTVGDANVTFIYAVDTCKLASRLAMKKSLTQDNVNNVGCE